MSGTKDWFSDLDDLLTRAEKVTQQSKEACCEARVVRDQLSQMIRIRSNIASQSMSEAAHEVRSICNAI